MKIKDLRKAQRNYNELEEARKECREFRRAVETAFRSFRVSSALWSTIAEHIDKEIERLATERDEVQVLNDMKGENP